MSLCSPTIVGPVSALNKSIRVQGQLAGAHVTIRAIGSNPRTVAKDILPSSDARIDLLPGMSLDAGDRLVAIQDFSGEASPPTPADLATAIQPVPTSAAQIGHVGYETHLYECGDALYISGAIPGALIQTSFRGSVHGSGVALEGIARYRLSSGMSPSDMVSTFQSVPGLPPGPSTARRPDPLPVAAPDLLPAPTIGHPLKACQWAVPVAGVIDGATVTVMRKGGLVESHAFDLPSLWVNLGQPLVEGETITVVQSFLRCRRHGKERGRRVGPALPVEVPHISGTLCAGSSRVPVEGLIPGAKVLIIFGDGRSCLGQTPPAVTSYTFDIGDALKAGQTVTVKQERCGLWSDQQLPPVGVETHDDIRVPPSIAGPLFDCGTRVFVKDIHPNAQVAIFATRSGGAEFPISDVVTMKETSGSIAVSPYLRTPDDVFAAQWACGGRRLDSRPVHVNPHPPLGMLEIKSYIHHRVYEGTTSVIVTGAVPGALIEMYTDDDAGQRSFLSRATADSSGAARVDLGRPLRTSDHLLARQLLCGDVTRFSFPPAEVIKRPDLDAWLGAHPQISAAIIWETPNGTEAYPSWPPAMKSDLAVAFAIAWNFGSFLQVDPVPNKTILADTQDISQLLDVAYAWPLFVCYVAQSLTVEIGNLVGWSITTYSPTGLAHLFDSRETFRWMSNSGGYAISSYPEGRAVPCAPHVAHRFMSDKLDASSRFSTIARLLDWCRRLVHFSGGGETANFYDQWQYRGLPPVLAMIQGTPMLSEPGLGVRHRTGGCWGTVGFLRAVLRTVNIPVGLFTPGTHGLPHFIEDGLYLSHGDDPYDGTDDGTIPIHELLIDQAQFDAWFGDGVPYANRNQNVGRRPIELKLKYLPKYLLKFYCADMLAGRSHHDGWVYEVFKLHYSVAELEAQGLWGRMDTKIASLGGCGYF